MTSAARRLLVCAAVLVLGLTSACAATSAAAPAHRGLTVWLPYWDMSRALTSTLDNADPVQTASPYLYSISGTSKVTVLPDAPSSAELEAIEAKGVQVTPMVTED